MIGEKFLALSDNLVVTRSSGGYPPNIHWISTGGIYNYPVLAIKGHPVGEIFVNPTARLGLRAVCLLGKQVPTVCSIFNHYSNIYIEKMTKVYL